MKNINISKDFLYQEYTINKKSSIQIAKEVGCSNWTVLNYLKKYNIKTRTISEARLKFDKILIKEFLVKEYIINKKSLNIIAKMINCSLETIRTYLRKFNIKIRTLSEALKGKYIGKNNWNYTNGVSLKSSFCIDCGKLLSRSAYCRGYKRCQICTAVGKNNPNYIEGLVREYPIKFNKVLKEFIRERDDYTCQKCSITEEEHLIVYGKVLCVHHIDYNKENCKEDNLITLCNECNIRVNYNRDYWKEYFKNLSKEKIYVNN